MEFQEYFKEKIIETSRLNHKGNNRLFKVTLENNEIFLLKQYSKTHMNDWQRGKKEFRALSFLAEQNFNGIPEALRFYEKDNLGIYSYEFGKPISQKDVNEENIFQATDFLSRMHKIEIKYKKEFSPASSACLSFSDYLDVIDFRFNRIKDYESSGSFGRKVKRFLDNEVKQKIKKVKSDFLKKTKGLNLEKSLLIEEQVLTPADFGFHNILFNQGKYTFVDFEYFGRDDPARQILDFYHHAKSSEIDKKLKEKFIESYIKKMGFSDNFKERLSLLHPVISLTWSLIYLNIFSKKQLEHLKFAQGNIDNLLRERLDNAKKKLSEIIY